MSVQEALKESTSQSTLYVPEDVYNAIGGDAVVADLKKAFLALYPPTGGHHWKFQYFKYVSIF